MKADITLKANNLKKLMSNKITTLVQQSNIDKMAAERSERFIHFEFQVLAPKHNILEMNELLFWSCDCHVYGMFF